MGDVTMQIIKGSTSHLVSNTKMATVAGTVWSVDSIAKWDYATAAEKYNGGCQDMFVAGTAPPFMMQAYQEGISLRSHGIPITNCTDFQTYKLCDVDTAAGAIGRGLCPVTCGCKSPASLLVMGSSIGGCSTGCTRHPDYTSALSQAKCEDQSLLELQNNSAWKYFAEQIVTVAATAPWPEGAIKTVQVVSSLLLQKGCDAVKQNAMPGMPMASLPSLCDESPLRGFPFRSLRLFCPVACNCTSGATNCPTSCPSS